MPKAYLKLLSGTIKHLCSADNTDAGCVTLCGCSVTRVTNWIRIKGLEGDECPRCAALAFSPSPAPKHVIFT